MGEFGLIERLARALAERGVEPAAGSLPLGIGDDAAVLRLPPDRDLVATIDALVEETHFRRDWSRPEELGWKALAVNVSDLGGMGARPLGALVTLAAPADTPVRWIDRLYRGLAECAARYGCPVVGGDTVKASRQIALSVAALGSVPTGRAVTRGGASAGDLVCVTGVLGESGAGLALLEQGSSRGLTGFKPLLDWHRRPEPPVEAGAVLAERGLATAMLDLSDGLASDLRHLCRRSGAGARVEAARLPISDATRRAAAELGRDPHHFALHGGEDYQLLFTVPPDRFAEVPPALGPLGVTATIVGAVTRRGITLVQPDGRTEPLRPKGFAHFAAAPER
ncbi:MAG: thiamine-phosphate kinase [Armatimonadota bacterium]